jgi:cytosine/adenosine deaminase-related metal-dependent hydrolase
VSTLIRNATILTMSDAVEIVHGAVGVREGRIVSVGAEPAGTWDSIINAGGAYLLPGFIQTHIHLCQTLFRSYADDMPLLDWLKRCVWPMEAAHTPATLRAATRLAAAELLLSGTTTVLTMETVHDTDSVFEALADTGMRGIVGKCMMDSTDAVPRRLQEDTRASIDESSKSGRASTRTNTRKSSPTILFCGKAQKISGNRNGRLPSALGGLDGILNAPRWR